MPSSPTGDLPFEVAVIACVQDQALSLAHWLVSLLGESPTPAWELIIVDQGSLDSTSGVLRELQGDFRSYRLARDTPPAKAWWWACQRASAPLVLFVDVDDPPPIGTIGAVLEQAQVWPNAAIFRAPGSRGGLPFVVRPSALGPARLRGPLEAGVAPLPCLGRACGASPGARA